MSKANQHFVGKLGNGCEIEVYSESRVSPTERNPVTLAVTVCTNALFFNGDLSRLIPHLKNAHGMTFEQIGIGINEICQSEGDCFGGWENFY